MFLLIFSQDQEANRLGSHVIIAPTSGRARHAKRCQVFLLIHTPASQVDIYKSPEFNSFYVLDLISSFFIFIHLFELLFVLRSTEFWDLYRSHLEPKVLCGDTRICFYGAVRKKDVNKALASAE